MSAEYPHLNYLNIRKHRERRRGRLYDVAIGIALLVVLACAMFPIMMGGRDHPAVEPTRATIANTKTALGQFQIDHGRYPTIGEGLDALVHNPGTLDGWNQLMETLPRDAWDRALRYRCPGIEHPDSYDLFSAGPDGKDGTADDITQDTR